MDPHEKMREMNKMGEFYGVEGVGPGSAAVVKAGLVLDTVVA